MIDLEEIGRQVAALRRVERDLAATAASIQDARLATAVQIARLEALIEDAGRAGTVQPPSVPREAAATIGDDRSPFDPSRQRGRAARLILQELERVAADGLTGTALKDAILAADLSADTSEKTKAQLKRQGLITHDPKARHWWAAGQGPAALEAAREKRRLANEGGE